MKEKILSSNWYLQTSEKISVFGEKISRTNFKTKDWYPVTIPATVVSGLVENDVYKDPYFGTNMKDIPGYKHGRKTHFSFFNMPDDSPFRVPWWYRNEFVFDDIDNDDQVWLQLKGVNYSANVWLNGKCVAGSDYVIGSFRQFNLNVSCFAKPGKKNVLAIEMFPPKPDDLCLTFIDWNPVPPDDCMGLWQPVSVSTTKDVAIEHPFVQSKLNCDTLDLAEISVSVDLVNTKDTPVTTVLTGKIENVTFQKEYKLNAFERKVCCLDTSEFSQLTFNNPRIWWPYQLGKPDLYELELSCTVDGELSDRTNTSFGIRDLQSIINKHGSRVFTINGKDILIRGSAWTPDLMLRHSNERDTIDLAMLKNMNFNAVRLEGKLATDYFWDICNREGILVLAGWPCCNHWEKWKKWKPGDVIIAKESLKSQLLRLRVHPCLISWFLGSDFPPPQNIEQAYLDVLEECFKDLPVISNASKIDSIILGKTGVKMSGPYSYVPPIHWYDNTKSSYADSFNTETGPDISIPVIESLKKMLPENQLENNSDAWNHHAGLSCFLDTSIVNESIDGRYGKSKDFEDFVKTAQIHSYECWRSMFEAYGRNYPVGTGVIAWMHNSAWPSVIWQLYDYYYEPTGGFFGAKKACEPLHIQYSYDDHSVWVINTTMNNYQDLLACASIKTMEMETKFDYTEKLSLGAYSKKRICVVPNSDNMPPVYFCLLALENMGKKITNCYWLPSVTDVFEEQRSAINYWPMKRHADLSALRLMPKSSVVSELSIVRGDNIIVNVSLQNNSDVLALFVKVRLYDRVRKEYLAPIYWNDNCVSIPPSDTIKLTGEISKMSNSDDLKLVVEGWNL